MRKKIILFVLLGLAGCADTKWPSWVTGEPPDKVLNAPRAVMQPASPTPVFPNLSSVPAKPNNYLPPVEQKRQIDELAAEAKAAAELRARLAQPLEQ